MTGPIDVAYVEIRPNFRDFERELRTGIDRALKQLGFTADRAASGISRDFEKAGLAVDASMSAGARGAERALENLGDKATREFEQIAIEARLAGAAAGSGFGDNFTRDANGRLRDSRGRFVADADRIGNDIGQALGQGARSAGLSLSDAFQQVGKDIGSVATSIPTLVLGFAALVAFGPLIIGLAAALASLAGILATVPAGLSVLGAAIAPLIIGFQGFGAALKKSDTAGGGAAVSTQQLADAEWRLSQAQKQARQSQEDLTRARRDAKRQLEDLQEALLGAALDERAANLAILEAEKRVRDTRRTGTRLERAEAQLALDQARQNLEELQIRNARLVQDQAVAAKKGVEGSDQVKAALDRQAQAVHSVADAQAALKTAQTGGGGGGGIDKQAEALAALSPAARSVAKEFIALQPVFHKFQQAVQEALFKPLQGVLTKFAATTLPHIQTGMEEVANSFGHLFANLGRDLSSPKAAKFFDKIFAATSRIIDKLGPSIEKILGALADATIAALPFVEQFATAFGTALSQFADFIEKSIKDGSFQKFIKEGVDTFKAIGENVKDLLGSLKELFTKENIKTGREFLTVITRILQVILGIWPATVDASRHLKAAIEDVKKTFKASIDYISGLLDFIRGKADNVGSGLVSSALAVLAHVPGFASGGIVMSPTLAMIGEAGPEAIIPLNDPSLSGMGGQNITFGPGAIQVSFDGGSPTPAEARAAGAAVGQGILNVLSARNIRTQVRTA